MANPPYGPGQPGVYQPPVGPRYDNDKGFFGSLFDFSFDNFIATKLVKFLYVLTLILLSVAAIIYLIAGLVALGNGSGYGLLLIVLAPVVWLFGLVVARLYLELVIVMFKISEDIKDIRDTGAMR